MTRGPAAGLETCAQRRTGYLRWRARLPWTTTNPSSDIVMCVQTLPIVCAASGCIVAESPTRPAAGQRVHVHASRPAGTHVPRRALRGVRRAVVLRRGEHLHDEEEQDDLARRLGVCS